MNSPISVLLYDENSIPWLDEPKISKSIKLHHCMDPLKVFDLVINKQVDVLLVSDKIKSINCVEFIDKLQSFDIFKDIPVAICSDITNKNYRMMLLDKGVLDVFETPSNVEQVAFRVGIMMKLAKLHQNLLSLAKKDFKLQENVNLYGIQQPLPDKKLFPSFDYMLVKSAVELIKSDYTEQDALDILAGKLHTNERTLTNAFFAIYQCSIPAWIREEKLLVAKKLILNGCGNITQIAHELGYADIAHLSRSFKNRFGFSPKKMYRKDYFFNANEKT